MVLGCRSGTHLTGGCLEVLLFDRGDDVRRGQTEFGQLIGLDPNSHAIVSTTEKVHLRDPGNPQQLVAQIDAAVVDEEVGIIGVLRRVERDEHQDAGALLLDGNSLLNDFLRQSGLSRRDPVLSEDVCNVLVRADFKIDVQQHATVTGV